MGAFDTVATTFGFGDWAFNLGGIGNAILWFVVVLFVVGGASAGIWWYFSKKKFKHTIVIMGMMGNTPTEKFTDTAKEIRIGRAGDKLFYLRKGKRYLPPPNIQTGVNKWRYWEREDGELINVGFENLDAVHRRLGFKFVDTDMRMQRLGIEKNLEYRHMKQSFWQQHGATIVNGLFIVLVALMMIVLFVQWRKTATAIQEAVNVANDVLTRAINTQSSPPKPDTSNEGSGLIPALIPLVFIRKWWLHS